jgi:hypothetical protein
LLPLVLVLELVAVEVLVLRVPRALPLLATSVTRVMMSGFDSARGNQDTLAEPVDLVFIRSFDMFLLDLGRLPELLKHMRSTAHKLSFGHEFLLPTFFFRSLLDARWPLL